MDNSIKCVSYNLISPRGYPVKFSIDFEMLKTIDWNMVMAQLDTADSQFEVRGYKADLKKPAGTFTKKPIEYVEGETCPTCKGRLIKKKTKTGKDFVQCENGGYDFKTRQATGCSFVRWG